MKCQFESTLKNLRENKMGRCHLQGIHTYDILRNPAYYQEFQYFSPAIPNRNNLIKDGKKGDDKGYQSDLVRLILNLAFIRQDEIEDFEFSKKEIISRIESQQSKQLSDEKNNAMFKS